MTKVLQVYKCEICGNIVEMLHEGAGALICCGQKMALYEENTREAATEKHIPVMEKIDGGFKVTVGSVIHPTLDEHYIEWIELLAGNLVLRKMLKPGDTPEATFLIDAESVTARAYCNLHGLWKGNL